MITPVGEDYKPDISATEKICENCANHDVSILALGTTGESPSVSTRDSRELVRSVSGFLKGRVKVYTCLTNNSLEDNIEDARSYMDAGADVIVSVLPSYFMIHPEQMYSYYWKLAESLQFPVMIYNIPSVTNMSIPIEVVRELSRHQFILGLKDSERDEERIIQEAKMFRDDKDFSFFAGYAAMSVGSLLEGADGIIPSTGNLVPHMFSALYQYAVSGNQKEAWRVQEETDEIARIYQKDRNLGESIQALKVMMSELGLCEPYAIPPLQTLDIPSQEIIREMTRNVMVKYNIREECGLPL